MGLALLCAVAVAQAPEPEVVATQGALKTAAVLWVQQTAELRLSSRGPVIGRAYRGASALVMRQAGRFAQVEVTGFEYQTQNIVEPGPHPLQALIERSALGEERPPAPQPPARRGAPRRDHAFSLSTDPSRALETQFVQGRPCGPLEVLEARGTDRRAVQYYAGFEVEGWSFQLQSDNVRGTSSCLHNPAAAGSKVPPGHVALPDAAQLELKDVLRPALWVPVVHGDRAACIAVKWAGAQLHYTDFDGARCHWEGVTFDASQLWGEGPACNRPGEGAEGGGFSWRYVGRRADRLLFLEGTGEGLVAVHPDDLAWVFFDAKKCAREADVQHAFTSFLE